MLWTNNTPNQNQKQKPQHQNEPDKQKKITQVKTKQVVSLTNIGNETLNRNCESARVSYTQKKVSLTILYVYV